MKTFQELKKNLKRNSSSLKPIKIALLGDTATQFLAQAIKATGFDSGWDINLFEAEFNQIDRQIQDPTSELYSFSPEIVILFLSTHKLLGKFNKLPENEKANFAQSQIEQISNFYTLLQKRLNVKVICYNFNEIDDAVFGNFANKTNHSFLYQTRKLNFKLMEFAPGSQNFYVCDLSTIQNKLGHKNTFQPSIYVTTEMVLSIDSLPHIAQRTIDIINALDGRFKKCLILDLDNTLWGGIIGDDGLENIQIGSLGIGKAFTEFQYWIKALKNRGIILAICSKNTESVAKEPFEKHPDMVLQLDDLSAFMANWENKANNIRRIQQILNIGFDSMVFLDDNPFERELVKTAIPEICVPDLPEDPAEYLEYLYSLNLFETISVSKADSERTKQYQTEAKRIALKQSFTNEADFLKSLNMEAIVEGLTPFNKPRIAQLTQRSNQFNLRTVRYTEADLDQLSATGQHSVFAFSLSDKLGNHGLISAIILKKENNNSLFIDTWLMSCRVLKRGMENFVLNTLVEFAQEKNYSTLKGEYIPTAKNEMVKDHYKSLGFKPCGDFWILDLIDFTSKTTSISIVRK